LHYKSNTTKKHSQPNPYNIHPLNLLSIIQKQYIVIISSDIAFTNQRFLQIQEDEEVENEKKSETVEEDSGKEITNPTDLPFFKHSQLALNIFLIFMGLPLTFTGFYYIRLSVILSGIITSNFFSMTIITLCYKWYLQSNVAIIITLLSSLMLSIGFAISMNLNPKFGTTITGMTTFSIIGMQLYGIICCIKGSAGPGWIC